jgi:ATP-dependent exoDNAse (exonuclease V) alpha subunit
MVKAFGDKVFDVIEAEPDRLREVTGIGVVRAKRITDAWAEQKIVREIMVFLHSDGVGTAQAVRIFKTYGADAVQVMTENPYRLARDTRGIGFKSADAIAMRLGIEKTAMIRLRAGISYALTEAMDEGHCGLPTEQLIPLAQELLEALKELILTALELERSDGAMIADKVGDTACTFLAGLYRAEHAIAERLTRIASGRLPWPWIDDEKAAPWIEKRSGLQLADSQRAASFDGRQVTYGFGELDTLVPAYAATIHKSQGSEYPAVVIPVLTQHYAMLQRNLLYTGITRGKRLVVLVGQKKAIAIAVRNVSGRRRRSKLDEWLRLGALRASSPPSKAG